MAKRKFKKYSTQDKVFYHFKRINDNSLSEDKRFYSTSWLSGFVHKYAEHNPKELKREYSERKANGKLSKDEHIFYQATIRGASERAKAKNAADDAEVRRFYGVTKYDV